ncbi:MAG: hypothetical protein PWP03_398 [Candidatus Woesearchaeota archaeon]|nr:hypothetical protein [Candidatus Woesearchaeota archaeon]MDN5327760.1 hypothetical protein [Candidatus Woesearchaeota archaeon]
MSFLGNIFGSKKKKGLEKYKFDDLNNENKTLQEDQLTKDRIGIDNELNSDILNQNSNFESNTFTTQNQGYNESMNPFNQVQSQIQSNNFAREQKRYNDPELLRIEKELEVISSKIETLKVLLENINQRLYTLENQQNGRRF